MCVNFSNGSRTLYRVLLASFCLLLVVASPLAAWPIKPANQPEAQESPSAAPLLTTVAQELQSTQPSETPLTASPNPSAASTPSLATSNVLTMSEDQFLALMTEVAKAKEAASAANSLEVIEDALAADSKREADRIIEEYNELAGDNAKQAEEIVDLAQEAKSKFYMKLGGVVGFEEDLMPTWGVSFAAGTKVGKNLLLEAGIEYDIGTFAKPIQGITDPTVDRLRITGSVGWLF